MKILHAITLSLIFTISACSDNSESSKTTGAKPDEAKSQAQNSNKAAPVIEASTKLKEKNGAPVNAIMVGSNAPASVNKLEMPKDAAVGENCDPKTGIGCEFGGTPCQMPVDMANSMISIMSACGKAAVKLSESTYSKVKEKGKEVGSDIADKASSAWEKAKEVSSDTTSDVVDKTKQVTGDVVDKTKKVTGNIMDRAKKYGSQAMDKSKEIYQGAKDKSQEMMQNSSEAEK